VTVMTNPVPSMAVAILRPCLRIAAILGHASCDRTGWGASTLSGGLIRRLPLLFAQG
jgi:hypothetical protein